MEMGLGGKIMTEDKSTWAIGGGLLAGSGIGLLFHHYNPLAIPGFMILGLGLGLVLTSLISRGKDGVQ